MMLASTRLPKHRGVATAAALLLWLLFPSRLRSDSWVLLVRVDAIEACNVLHAVNVANDLEPQYPVKELKNGPHLAFPFHSGSLRLSQLSCFEPSLEYQADLVAFLLEFGPVFVLNGPPDSAVLVALPTATKPAAGSSGTVTKPGGDLAEALVKAGLAKTSEAAPAKLQAAQREARDAHRGWWSSRKTRNASNRPPSP